MICNRMGKQISCQSFGLSIFFWNEIITELWKISGKREMNQDDK